jgi:Zn-dependent M28 family amino/carboxypeptidase
VRASGEAPFAALWLPAEAHARLDGLEPGELLPAEFELEIAGGGRVAVENVAALWPGAHPERGHELIVLSAHYDHEGVRSSGEVMNGADDNASGCAALLAVAEALAQRGPLDRGVLLLWVGAEELGLLGSAAWCREPDLPAGLTPVANLNLDMVGRNAAGYLELTPSSEHEAWNPLAALALELAALEGFEPPENIDRDFERSDQASFHGILGLPVAFLSTGEHADYHQPGDDSAKIDADKIARVSRLALRMLERAQALELAPRAPQPTPSEVGVEPDPEPER